MATIHVDGKTYEVNGADNLLQTCLSLGLDIPYFCWHPALGSVGACRQCAVKQYANADDKRGRLVMSCMTPSSDNTMISIDDEEAKQFRASVVEWLMTNHPHDCPVCEEGGHCHLQDMTVMTGHNTRRYRFQKRTHQNQDLGPFVNHEMNRCIACYRCVRYYKDYAGGEDLGVYGAHDNVYFGRVEDGKLESEFSGNLTEVCPTGVFTDKTHSERYNRKWDMQFAPSVCQGCSVGCNISPGERYGELRRIENRYNGSVNHYFLCDRGRFGYGYVNREDRPRQPLQKVDGVFQVRTLDQALDSVAAGLKGARVIGIGSPRASLEANFALRAMVGAEHFHQGIGAAQIALDSAGLNALRTSGADVLTLRQLEDRDAVLVLGEDVTQTAPRVALSLRQAVKSRARAMAAEKRVAEWQAAAVKDIAQNERSPLIIASLAATRLDDVASDTLRAASADLARFGFAVAHAIDSNAPAVADLDAATVALARKTADTLLAAERPLVVTGTGAGDVAVIEAAANVARALKARGKAVGINVAFPAVNSVGAALIGGGSLESALQALASGQADTLVVLENDLFRQASAADVRAALQAARLVVAIDHQLTETGNLAHWILPAASFAEGDGTVVSQEGRAQRFFQVFEASYYKPELTIKEGWRWVHALDRIRHGHEVEWTLLDDATAATEAGIPALQGIVSAAPGADYRIQGLKIAREPRRYSGRTAMRANLSVHEPRAPQDADTALAFSMEGYSGPNEASRLIPFAWAPGWNSPQSWNKFQDEVGGHLKAGDPGVRLFDAPEQGAYATAVPAAFAARGDALAIAPLYHLYGSDELTARAEVTASQLPAASAALNPADAARLNRHDGGVLSLDVAGQRLELPVVVRDDQPAGTVGLVIGLPGQAAVPLAGWAQLAAGV